MLSLTEFINESTAIDSYGVLLDHIELKEIPNLEKLTSLIKEGIIQANSRYKVLRIEAVENLNKETQEWNAEKLKDALQKEEKRVIAHMQTKPGIMKRSEEKRQKYINDRLEKFKSTWSGEPLKAVEYDEHRIRFAWHNDITSEHSHTLLGQDIDNIDKVAKSVAEYIDRVKNRGEYWGHLTGISISVDNSDLTTNFFGPYFHIIPMFDEETEKKLSKHVRSFSDYMSKQYNSDRYMGD